MSTSRDELPPLAYPCNHFGLIKTQIAVPALRKCDQASLDEIASMALYFGDRPLDEIILTSA